MYQKVVHTENARKLPLPQDAWMLYGFENLELIRLDLRPGEAIENHVNPWRIVFYVLEGEGILGVEGSDKHLRREQTMAVEAGLLRYWKNTGKSLLRLLVIKTKDKE